MCWSCILVHAKKNQSERLFSNRSDHWWIECAAYNKNAQAVFVTAFDWWRPGATSGEDPGINRDEYPYLNYDDSAMITHPWNPRFENR